MKISLLDKAVLGVAILFCVASFMWLWQASDDSVAQIVELRSPDQTQRFSLFEDRIIKVDGPLGGSEIEIRAGQARFRSSSCNKQLCVHAGWLSRSGQIAVCMPNGISLSLLGQKSYDAINF